MAFRFGKRQPEESIQDPEQNIRESEAPADDAAMATRKVRRRRRQTEVAPDNSDAQPAALDTEAEAAPDAETAFVPVDTETAEAEPAVETVPTESASEPEAAPTAETATTDTTTAAPTAETISESEAVPAAEAASEPADAPTADATVAERRGKASTAPEAAGGNDKAGRNSRRKRPDRPVNSHTVEEGIEIYELEELAEQRKAMPDFPDSNTRERDWGEDGSDEPPRKGISPHLILWLIILVLFLASVVIYLIWSRGTDAKVKEGEVTNSYSVEVNDEMVYLSDAKLEGHEDDGVTTILCLGNEPFSDDMTETGLAGQIRELADNVEVINASFPNSQVTCYERKYDPSEDTRDDVFNLFYVANSINIDDYSAMETVASFHEDDERYADAIETLQSTDFDKVDMIAIMYDAIDYRNGASMQNPDDVNDLTTYTNCLKFAFQLIQDRYPWIRIVFLSPYYINDGESDSRTNDIGNGTLVNYWQWACDTCAANSVSFLDNYYGSVNENNYKEYTSDGIHLNEDGRTKIADHFVYTVINKVYTEYDAGNLMVAE